MAHVASMTVGHLATVLRAPDGLPYALEQMSLGSQMALPIAANLKVSEQNLAIDLAEKTSGGGYPVVHVFCERVENTLREKFRTFSGTSQVVAEIRVTHEHLDKLGEMLHLLVDGVTDVLDRSRGRWSDGMSYAGGYDVEFLPVKSGGKRFVQAAKVRLQVNLSIG